MPHPAVGVCTSTFLAYIVAASFLLRVGGFTVEPPGTVRRTLPTSLMAAGGNGMTGEIRYLPTVLSKPDSASTSKINHR
jgi:hypothetical protein